MNNTPLYMVRCGTAMREGTNAAAPLMKLTTTPQLDNHSFSSYAKYEVQSNIVTQLFIIWETCNASAVWVASGWNWVNCQVPYHMLTRVMRSMCLFLSSFNAQPKPKCKLSGILDGSCDEIMHHDAGHGTWSWCEIS